MYGNLSRFWHFNPRSPHGERHCRAGSRHPSAGISIHAPRTGSDRGMPCRLATSRAISIHAPRTGSDVWVTAYARLELEISIHAPRTGSDIILFCYVRRLLRFQSTLPARGATQIRCFCPCTHAISIHAPRTGSDLLRAVDRKTYDNFNPRSPHGERQRTITGVSWSIRHFNPRSPHGERPSLTFPVQTSWTFQSTLPARGATERMLRQWRRIVISIHAPRTGSDCAK